MIEESFLINTNQDCLVEYVGAADGLHTIRMVHLDATGNIVDVQEQTLELDPRDEDEPEALRERILRNAELLGDLRLREPSELLRRYWYFEPVEDGTNDEIVERIRHQAEPGDYGPSTAGEMTFAWPAAPKVAYFLDFSIRQFSRGWVVRFFREAPPASNEVTGIFSGVYRALDRAGCSESLELMRECLTVARADECDYTFHLDDEFFTEGATRSWEELEQVDMSALVADEIRPALQRWLAKHRDALTVGSAPSS